VKKFNLRHICIEHSQYYRGSRHLVGIGATPREAVEDALDFHFQGEDPDPSEVADAEVDVLVQQAVEWLGCRPDEVPKDLQNAWDELEEEGEPGECELYIFAEIEIEED
jgi:hypothetical protein